MKMTERIRQAVLGPLDLDRIRSYEKEGWKLAALEWERLAIVARYGEGRMSASGVRAGEGRSVPPARRTLAKSRSRRCPGGRAWGR